MTLDSESAGAESMGEPLAVEHIRDQFGIHFEGGLTVLNDGLECAEGKKEMRRFCWHPGGTQMPFTAME